MATSQSSAHAPPSSKAKSLEGPTISHVPELYSYLFKYSLKEHPVVAKLRERVVEQHEWGVMAGAPDEAQFLAWLLKLTGAKKVIEVGTFLGYTTLVLALALPEDGKIVTLDISEDYTSIAKPFWNEAGVAHKIDLKIEPAVEALQKLVNNGEDGTYDLVFIDADKANYGSYYESAIKLLKPGGVIAVDNVLWDGKVLHSEKIASDESTKAIHTLNEKIAEDTRVEHVMLSIADGLSLCRKK